MLARRGLWPALTITLCCTCAWEQVTVDVTDAVGVSQPDVRAALLLRPRRVVFVRVSIDDIVSVSESRRHLGSVVVGDSVVPVAPREQPFVLTSCIKYSQSWVRRCCPPRWCCLHSVLVSSLFIVSLVVAVFVADSACRCPLPRTHHPSSRAHFSVSLFGAGYLKSGGGCGVRCNAVAGSEESQDAERASGHRHHCVRSLL